MDWLTLGGYVLAAMAAGSTGAMFKPGEWYKRLTKPSWTPPDWLFPVAWTVLYAAMVAAAYRMAKSGDPLAQPALAFWAAQIALNAVWSPVFFGARRVGAALVVLSGLWLAVAATVVLSFRVDLLSGFLLLPYLVWASYAGALNAWIWRNNPGAKDL
ncbi:tryptophan-rich sensory protein TspO [Halovulum dunhuangense]